MCEEKIPSPWETLEHENINVLAGGEALKPENMRDYYYYNKFPRTMNPWGLLAGICYYPNFSEKRKKL